MKKSIITFFSILVVSVVQADSSNTNLFERLSSAITNLCPKAEIRFDKYVFTAKHDTMIYTIHRQSKIGEFYPTTYKREGPGFRGFMLKVGLYDGQYEGQARNPQTLHGIYFPTFFDAPSTDNGKRHYKVYFSYGARLDSKLKKTILEAIPRTKFPTSRSS